MSSKGKSSAETGGRATLVPRLRFPEFREAGGWAHSPMGEVYSFRGNNSLSRDKLNYLVGSIRNIHYGDIHTKFSSHFYVTKELVPFVNEAQIEEIRETSFCAEGDLLFADASEDLADIGKCIEIVDLNSEMVVAGLHTILARPANKKVAVGFGGHLFQSGSVRRQIQREAQGAKVLGISPRRLQDIQLPLPSLPEQQKIADCLNSADALIAAQGRKVEALRAHKKGLMQQLFPQEGETQPRLRFPEFEGAGEWQVRAVGDVFRVTRGEVLSMTLVSDTPTEEARYPVYSSQTKNIGLAGYYSRFLYQDAITWTTDGANAGDVNFRRGKFFCTNVCGVLISKDGHANACVGALLNSVTRSHVSYVGNPKLMNGVMAGIEIPFPSVPEQQRIADCLTSLDDLIAAETRMLDTLKTHKKGLMQQLFPQVGEDDA